MDLEAYLQLVLSRNSAEAVDLTSVQPVSRPPVLIDLTMDSLIPPLLELGDHVDILVHLAEVEAARPLHKKGLSREKLNKLGCWRVRKSVQTPSQLVFSSELPLPASCAICLDDFKEATHVRSLRCGHVFHKKCIDTWLCHNASCPLDRGKLGDEDR